MAVKPKLALIPSGVKASKVYSVLPSDGTGDFDFSRSGEATRINKDGLIETVASNVPRLNYPLIDGVVSGCPSLLLENSSTNLVTYSEDFTQSAWVKTRVSISSNVVISPDGSLNASKIDFNLNGGTTSSDLSQMAYVSSSLTGDYTSSFYLKSFDSNSYTVTLLDPNGATTTATITPEWQRFTFYNGGGTTSANLIRIRLRGNENTSDTASLLAWGFQLEQGSYPTSYIPTQGSIGTRVAESCIQTPPSGIIGQTEGTMYVDVDINTLSTDGQVLRLTNGTSSTGRIAIERNVSNQNQLRITQWGGATLYIPISVGNRYKIAVGYDSSNSNVYVNGSSIGTSFFTNVAELNRVSLGCNEVDGSIFNDTIKEAQLYNTRLSNAELQALTQI